MMEQAHRLETLPFGPNGRVPNSRYPVLIHRGAVAADPGVDLADAIEATFRRHDWLNNWRELGVYDYPHLHSTTHEALGMARGRITLRLGDDAEHNPRRVRGQAGRTPDARHGREPVAKLFEVSDGRREKPVAAPGVLGDS